MATIPYSKEDKKFLRVRPGWNTSYRDELVEYRYESGTRQRPFVDKTLITERDVSRSIRGVGTISGDSYPIPCIPYVGEGSAQNFGANFLQGYYGYMDIPLIRFSLLRATAKNRAIARFAEDIMKDVSTSDLGISIMEGRDTLDMLNTRCVNLGRSIGILKMIRGKPEGPAKRWHKKEAYKSFSDAVQLGKHSWLDSRAMYKNRQLLFKDLSDKISSGWLEYWLGWAPFVSEIGNLINVLSSAAKTLPKEGIFLKSTGLTKGTFTGNEVGAYKKGTVNFVVHYRYTLSGRVTVSDGGTFLNRRAGLTNLPGIIWAGVRLSFIVDWFVNIGGMLKLLDAFTGVKWMDGCYSETISVWADENFSYRSTNGGPYTGSGQSVSYHSQTRRKRLTTPPRATMIPAIRDFSKIFEGKEHRAATSVSLLVQQLLK